MANVDFITDLVPSLKNIKDNQDYIENRFNIYKNYMEQSELPVSYILQKLENPFEHLKIFKDNEIKGFVDNISDYLEGEFNCIFNFPAYINTDKLAAYIIQSYIKNYLTTETPIRKIIYINTPLLMADFKRLISHGSESDFERTFVHRPDTIKSGVENADFVIWDMLTNISTDYDRMELFRILNTRHKKGLGNLFFISGGKVEAVRTLSAQIADMFYGYSMVDIT